MKWIKPALAVVSLGIITTVCVTAWARGPLWLYAEAVSSPAEIIYEADSDYLIHLIRQLVMTPTLIVSFVAVVWILTATRKAR
jgi:hypothetical protein